MSIPLAAIGGAVLEVLGFNPTEFDYSSDSEWVAHKVFDDDVFWQPTAGGEKALTVRMAVRPHIFGGLEQYTILKLHHEKRDIVPFIRLTSGWAGEMLGNVGIRRVSHTETKLAPDGVGRRHEFEAGLILVGDRAGGF